MSRRYHAKFFSDAKTQSRIKLRVYEAFLTPWSQKLGSRHRLIYVVDGFAGPGRYASGEPGSPVIALRRAEEVAQQGKFLLHCILGDTSRRNQDSLYRLSGRYPAASARILERSFWESVDTVIQVVRDDPALVFVDPFGLAGVEFDKLQVLVQGLKNLDLIVNFRSPAAPRLATHLSAKLTRAVGSDDWTVGTISEVFRRNLQRAGGFLPPATLPIKERFGGSVRSELIIAARHADAYQLWNDRIILEAERLAREAGDPVPERDAETLEIQSRLREWGAGRTRWRRPQALDWYCTTYCGEAHSGAIKRAIDALLRLGAWRRQNAAAQIDQDWLLPG